MLPDAPIALAVDPATDRTIILVMACLALAALGFALWQFARSRRPVVLMLFIAGGCMMIMEPLVDTVAGCWFAANSTIAYTGYGRPIPVWVCLTYFVYFGVGSAVVWMALQRGMTRGQLWLFFLGEVVADIVLETTLLRTSLYTYYGNQPLLIGPFPLWWAAVNALIAITAAAVTYEIARRVDGWRLIIIIPATVCASAAANAAAGWPAWFVINSNVGKAATTVGGVLSVVIACATIELLSRRVGAQSVPRSMRPAGPASDGRPVVAELST